MTRTYKFRAVSSLLLAMQNLSPDYQVHYPVPDDQGIDRFYSLADTDEAALKNKETSIYQTLLKNQPVLVPPKGFLLPETEYLLQFVREGNTADVQPKSVDSKTRVIFGIKACDLESFKLLDEVFLSEPEDPRYRQRRDQTITIAAPCASESVYCLCSKFGVDKHSPAGADVVMVPGEKNGGNSETNNAGPVYLQSITDKGEKLLEALYQSISEDENFSGEVEADPEPPHALKVAAGQEKRAPGSAKSEAEGESESEGEDKSEHEPISLEATPDRMEELFEAAIWDELAMRCLNCGICTYYCPTCHCFDIQDFYRKKEGNRYRKWDSCMFCSYSEMAAGLNPRMHKRDRVRNRFFHKLNYLPKTNFVFGCTGCGRCVKHCPVGISINTVLEKIGGERIEK